MPESTDPMAPAAVIREDVTATITIGPEGSTLTGEFDLALGTDYRALWDRCEKAEEAEEVSRIAVEAAAGVLGPGPDEIVVNREDFKDLLDCYEDQIDGSFQEGYGLMNVDVGNRAEKADRAFVARLRSALNKDGDGNGDA